MNTLKQLIPAVRLIAKIIARIAIILIVLSCTGCSNTNPSSKNISDDIEARIGAELPGTHFPPGVERYILVDYTYSKANGLYYYVFRDTIDNTMYLMTTGGPYKQFDNSDMSLTMTQLFDDSGYPMLYDGE